MYVVCTRDLSNQVIASQRLLLLKLISAGITVTGPGIRLSETWHNKCLAPRFLIVLHSQSGYTPFRVLRILAYGWRRSSWFTDVDSPDRSLVCASISTSVPCSEGPHEISQYGVVTV